ncbi:putative transcription factor isoform X1 [Capsicum annuum]|nr:putative transcription factor isoform X1 [Capsicum annuum]
MKELEIVKEYSDRLLSIVNKIRLLGTKFKDSRIVEKILVIVTERYDVSITTLENTKDTSKITLAELLNTLQAQEQGRLLRQDGMVEGSLETNYKNQRKPKTNNHHEVSELEVCTLGGDEKWRNLGQVPYLVWHDFGQVWMNGALHWMDPVNKDSIYSFDIETEKLKSVPGSPGLVLCFASMSLRKTQGLESISEQGGGTGVYFRVESGRFVRRTVLCAYKGLSERKLQKQSDGSNLVEVDLSLGSSSASPDEQADSQDHDEQADNQNHAGDNSDWSTPFASINRDSSINSLIRCSRSHYGAIAALNRNFR